MAIQAHEKLGKCTNIYVQMLKVTFDYKEMCDLSEGGLGFFLLFFNLDYYSRKRGGV